MRTKLSIKACFKTNENICNIKKIILKQPTSKFLKKEFKKIRNQKPKSFQQINNVKQKRKKLGHLNSVQNNKKMILDLYGREIHRASNNTNCTNNNLKNIVLIKNKLKVLMTDL